jgi:hypothetical protein
MSRKRTSHGELACVADIPDRIVLERHRDLRSPAFHRSIRYVLLALVALLLVLGLANVFGQRPETHVVNTPTASFELYAPSHLRGGLLFEARFTVHAHKDLKDLLLQLSPGWSEGIQHNTADPNPIGNGSRNGDLLYDLGHVPAGHIYRLFLQFQVNATNVGHRRADATFYDGAAKLATIHRTITVFP